MADFTTNPIESQGAGAQVVAPVQKLVTREPDYSGVANHLLEGLSNYTTAARKEAAKQDQDKVVQAYLQREKTFIAARDSGQWSPSRVMSASQANYAEFIAANPHYIDDLDKARKTLYAGTGMGEAEKDVERERAKRLKEDDLLTEAGFVSYPGMSEQTRQSAINTVLRAKALDKEFQRHTARTAEQRAVSADNRAQVTFEQQLHDRESADMAMDGLNTIMRDHLETFRSMTGDVLRGDMPYEQATMLVQGKLADIKAQGIAIAGTRNQALVNPVLSIFEDMARVTLEMKKPGAERDKLQAEYEAMILKTKMAFMGDPKTRANVVASMLLPQSPEMALQAKGSVVDRISTVEKMGLNVPITQIPSIVGDREVEGPAIDILAGSLKRLQAGTALGDKMKTETSAINVVNTLLRQTEDQVNRGAGPETLTKIASFYASPEFGSLAASGKLDNTTMYGAKRAFQAYNEAVVKAVEKEFTGPAWKDWSGGEAPAIQDLVDLNFSGGKVTFTPINTSKNLTVGARGAAQSMKQSEKAITNLVIIGAHMEGTQNYQKYWEDNKHLILPNVYADPQRFPPGYVNEKTGWKFKGGAFFSARNWEKPKEASGGK